MLQCTTTKTLETEKIENLSKVVEDIKKNQMEILELKNIIIGVKN